MFFNEYARRKFSFYYLQSGSGAEIDIVIERPGGPPALIELKSTNKISVEDIHGLESFRADFPGADLFCLSNDPMPQRFGEIRALPWRDGLRALDLV